MKVTYGKIFSILLYIFPVQAKFENTIFANIKNALLMSIANLGYTLLMLVIITTFGLCFVKSKTFLGIFVVCGFGFVTWILSNFFIIIFRKYLPDECQSVPLSSHPEEDGGPA